MAKLLAALSALLLLCGAHGASFQVAQDAFLLNGAPVQLRSGSIHYHRTSPSTWADRLRRLHAMGLNTVQTYVHWNFHSQAPGVYNFTGSRDLVAFIKAVQAEGLLLNLRAGPYICGETDFGGLPAYLLATPGIASGADLRTNNTAYLAAVSEWWGVLLPLVAPLTVANGGPIAMVQIENEFGSYGNTKGNPRDYSYMMALRALALQHLPAGTQLYTTDGDDMGYLNAGTLPGIVFATGDGGGPPWAADGINPPGWRAHLNSELYPGWLTHWGEGMANVSAMSTVGAISGALGDGGSINLYMGYGGSNFGYTGGANGGGSGYAPVIQSYDYNAPVEEGGGHGYSHDGDKYDAIRRILSYWAPASEPAPPAEPPAPPTAAYGALALSGSAALLDNLDALGPALPANFTAPPTMEAVGAPTGYMLYTATLPALQGAAFALAVDAVSDYATVHVNGAAVGTLWRPTAKGASVALPPAAIAAGGAVLQILLENMGHLNYGRDFFDPKGFSGLTINGAAVPGLAWSVRPLGLQPEAVNALPFSAGGAAPTGPAFFRGTLALAAPPADTYLTLCGWGKGQLYVNGEHLGRHWAARGPQHTYYVPAALLVQGSNAITVFEHLGAPANASVAFASAPDFTGAVCGLSGGAAARGEAALPSARHAPQARARAAAPPLNAAPTGQQCAAAPAAAGTDLTVQPCDPAATPAAASAWAWVTVAGEAGLLQLAANASLCAAQVGKNPDSGQPNYALAPCDKADRSQHLLGFPLNGNTLLNPVSGQCMEAFGGINAGPGSRVELYGCNGGANQGWVWSGAKVVNQQGQLCLAAC